MLKDKEHYDLIAAFERSHKERFDKEDKALWPKGIIYQDGRANELFLAYRNGYAYSQADTRSDIQNLESSRDGYRRDVETLRDALLGLLDALPSATTHPVIKRAKDALRETCHD